MRGHDSVCGCTVAAGEQHALRLQCSGACHTGQLRAPRRRLDSRSVTLPTLHFLSGSADCPLKSLIQGCFVSLVFLLGNAALLALDFQLKKFLF